MEQGLRGCVSIVEIDGVDYVRKQSLVVDVSIELEALILNKLESLNSPHFPKLFKYELLDRIPTMYMEFIDGKMLRDCDEFTDEMIENLIGIILTAAAIMNEELGIIHNDLHARNVMLRRTNVDVDRYIFRDGRILEFKTYGYEPVIIDFGLANSNDSKMTLTTAFTDIGIFPFELDYLADARRLCPDKFDRKWITKSGWFKPGTFPDFSEKIFLALGIDDSNQELIDLCTSRINLPLIKSKLSVNPKEAFTLFHRMTEYMKINDKLNSVTDRLLFFKTVLERKITYVKKEYGKLFTITSIRKLKCHLKYLIVSINDIVYKLSRKSVNRKLKIYSKCVNDEYINTRDVAESLTSPLSISKNSIIRIYDVEKAAVFYELA